MTDLLFEPIGLPAVALLRRAVNRNGCIAIENDADRCQARACVSAGYLRIVAKGSNEFVLTRAGEIYLDKLARAH
ncbi:MAG: hypothetical protein EON58_03885 [Alphaproteobacteria bacterium]|nr:MAG: hypothetical protein EON58_03885 [Alphaproteobacteria bacterium]